MVEEEAEDGAAHQSRLDPDHQCFRSAVGSGGLPDAAADQGRQAREGDHGEGRGGGARGIQ